MMRVRPAGVLAVCVLVAACAGCHPKTARTTAANSLGALAAEARSQKAPQPLSEGSLWVSQGKSSNLFRDFKARDVNDIVTIRVSETTDATATADAKNSKDTKVEAGFEKLFGAEKGIKELPSLVAGTANSSFKGEGSTTRATTLTTTIAARVVEVFPNGNLLIEGVRELRLNNETQTVYLSGVVRPEDISRANVVNSAAVAQMEVRVQGRGTVSQPIKPGWLFRILNGVLPF
jgi:flagellar L-ring protein precursor FlgH